MTIMKFGYCQNKRWYAVFGLLIRLFEKLTGRIDASHCYVEIHEDIKDPKDVYRIESVWPKGRIRHNYDHSKVYKDVVVYSFVIGAEVSEILEYSEKHIVNKDYSLMQNVFLAYCNILVQKIKQLSFIENIEFNGRVKQNCTEAQIMLLAKFLNIHPTEGLDNFSVTEAHDLVKSVWELKGMSK